MRDGDPITIRLSDYQAPVMQIREVHLAFDIQPGATTVSSRLRIERAAAEGPGEIRLDGQELELLEVRVDGETISANAYRLDEDSLTLFDLPDRCEVQIMNRIAPEQNTALEGLYKSGNMYCTQCEAEGFRIMILLEYCREFV
jgi:aminopeptidase N